MNEKTAWNIEPNVILFFCKIAFCNIVCHSTFISGVVIQSNKGLREVLEATSMPSYKYYTVKSTDGAYGKQDGT